MSETGVFFRATPDYFALTLYQVVDGKVTHKNINPDLGIPTICVVWDGQRDISADVINKKEKLDIGGRIVDESDVPNLTLDEGVRFAETLLKKSCDEYEVCGEPIFSLVITFSNGIKWVHK